MYREIGRRQISPALHPEPPQALQAGSEHQGFMWETLWQFRIAVEHDPIEIVDLPTKGSDFP